MAVVSRTDNFLMFRYRPSLGLQVFRVTPDDRTIQARCQGTTHEFAVNAEMCAGNHLFLRNLVPPANRLQYVPHPWADRVLYENRMFDENGFEITPEEPCDDQDEDEDQDQQRKRRRRRTEDSENTRIP